MLRLPVHLLGVTANRSKVTQLSVNSVFTPCPQRFCRPAKRAMEFNGFVWAQTSRIWMPCAGSLTFFAVLASASVTVVSSSDPALLITTSLPALPK